MNGSRNSSKDPGVILILVIAITAVILVFLEGISSLAMGISSVLEGHKSYQDYHEVIGWTGRKNTNYPDFFGPDKYVNINGQGFREDSDTPLAEPQGSARIICSGNSFTFGQGVANDETWCHQLRDYLPGIDTVNLGQSGYGVDQSYLWYMEAGQKLQHRVHVFAFISADLDRMSVTEKWNTGKPILRLRDNEIEIANVPVPRFKYWLTRKARAADLRMVELGDRILTRLLRLGSPDSPLQAVPDRTRKAVPESTRKVARRVFEELVKAGTTAGRSILFVYLPTEKDIAGNLAWRNWTREVMAELHYPFVDITPAMRQLPAGRVAGFFIDGGVDEGHYTYAGNRWIAENISRELEKNYSSILSPVGSNR